MYQAENTRRPYSKNAMGYCRRQLLSSLQMTVQPAGRIGAGAAIDYASGHSHHAA